MPREMRMLVFSEDELRTALVDEWVRTARPMPRMRVESVELDARDKAAILHFRTQDGDVARQRYVAPTEVAAALIRYCLQRSIPLPRYARKHLKIENGALALVFNTDSG